MFVVHVAAYKWVNNRRYAVVGRSAMTGVWFGEDFATFKEASNRLSAIAHLNTTTRVNDVCQLYHADIRQCGVESVSLNPYWAVIAGAKEMVQQLADSEAVLEQCQRLADDGDGTAYPTDMSGGVAVP